MERDYKLGTTAPKPGILPPITPDTDDHIRVIQVDDLNRTLADIYDPIMPDRVEGLVLATQARLDIASRTRVAVNPNGNPTRYFYDGKGNKRFAIDPMGGVTEWHYDAQNRVDYQRSYNQAIDVTVLSDTTTCDQVAALLEKNSHDPLNTTTWLFYDTKGERFRVSSLGSVQETRYDAAGAKISTIDYQTPLDPSEISSSTLEDLITWADQAAKPGDSCTYYIVDEAGRTRFIIDPEQFITEQIFDTFGHVIQKTVYANRVDNPAALAKLPAELIRNRIQRDEKQDATSYFVYNAFNQLEFEVAPEKNMMRYAYDERGNKIAQGQFDGGLYPWPDSYRELVFWLRTIDWDNCDKKRLILYYYNEANQLITQFDSLQNVDQFIVDIFGNTVRHIDRKSGLWRSTFDRANRKRSEETPEVEVTPVAVEEKDATYLTRGKPIRTTLKRRFDVDKMSNQIRIIEADGTPEARVLQASYDRCNRLEITEIPDVPVDVGVPKQPARFEARPEKIVTIATRKIYNAKGFVVAEQNKNKQWIFYVRDAENRVVYKVNTRQAVTHFERDAQGHVRRMTRYATLLGIVDLTPYLNPMGLPQSVVETQLKKKPDEDRVKVYQLDRRGDCVLESAGSVFYFVPNGDKPPVTGIHSAQTRTEYNAARNPILRAQLLIDPVQGETWAETMQWFDRNQQLIAKVEPNSLCGYATRYKRDSFGQETKRTEFAASLVQRPEPRQSVEALDKLIADVDKDKEQNRYFETQFDKRGRKIEETSTGVFWWSTKTTPTFYRHYRYGATSTEDKPIAVTIYGITKYFFYNALDWKIAETDVTRDSLDIRVNLTPLTHYGFNCFGQIVATERFKQGTKEIDPDKFDPVVVPQPIARDSAADQLELVLYDRRGLPSAKQDGERHMTANTYTLSGKMQRAFYLLTNPAPEMKESKTESKAIAFVTHLDEKYYNYDASDNTIALMYQRDSRIVDPAEDITETDYNAFDEPFAEGPVGKRPVYWKRDTLGRVWSSNAGDGMPKLLVYNLNGLQSQETSQWRSTTDTLSDVVYSELPELVTWDIRRLECTHYTRDKGMRVTDHSLPAYYTSSDTLLDDVPLNLTAVYTLLTLDAKATSTQTVLTWPLPQERNVSEVICTLRPTTDPSSKTVVPITLKEGYCSVDVSALPTGIYQYQIDYFVKPPATVKLHREKHVDPIYRSQGHVQFTTNASKESLAVVPLVQQTTSTIVLKGRTANVTAIELWQESKLVAKKPVQIDPTTQQVSVDLSDQVSGIYTLQLVTQDKSVLPRSLPFTLYTRQPSSAPLAREIRCETTLKTLDNCGKLVWRVPVDVAQQKIKVRCDYSDEDEKTYTQEFVIDATTDEGSYGDLEHYNLKFARVVKKVQTLTLSLQLSDTEWVTLRNAEPPSKTSEIKPSVPAEDAGWDLPSVSAASSVISEFRARDILYITPLPNYTSPPQLRFLDTSLGRFARWIDLHALAITPKGVVVDVTGLALGIYPYELGDITSTFAVSRGGSTYAPDAWATRVQQYQACKAQSAKSMPLLAESPAEEADWGHVETTQPVEVKRESKSIVTLPIIRPTRHFEYDRWSNATVRIDAEGNRTDTTYNLFDKVMTIMQPLVDVVHENGTVESLRPVTYYDYNLRGYCIQTINPNGNTEDWRRDKAGQVIEYLMDEGLVFRQSWFNCFGQEEKYSTNGGPWTQTFDRNNRLLTNTSPLKLTQKYTHNELGNRITSTAPAGNTTLYIYDVRRNCTSTILPLGQRTDRRIDRNGQFLEECCPGPDGYKLLWERDHFSHALTHVDASGATITYQYDKAFQLQSERSSGGDRPRMVQPRISKQWRRGEFVDEYELFYIAADRDLEYTHTAGRLVQLTDHTTGKSTRYGHDREGQRVSSETYKNDGTLLQKVRTHLDGLGRDTWTFDTFATLSTGYDAASNRRCTHAILYVDPSAPIKTEQWFTYDTTECIKIFNGIQTGSGVTIAPGQGVIFTHYYGLRFRQYSRGDKGDDYIYEFTYDDDSRLQKAVDDWDYGHDYHSERVYHPQGYVERYTEESTDGKKNLTLTMACDANGRQTVSDQVLVSKPTGNAGPSSQADAKSIFAVATDDTTRVRTEFNSFTGMGLPLHQHTDYNGGVVKDDIDFTYQGYGDEKRQTRAAGTRWDEFDTDHQAMVQIWDVNGGPNITFGADDGTGQSATNFYFETTPEGQVLSKQRLEPAAGMPGRYWGRSATRFFYDVRGFHWGDYQWETAADAPRGRNTLDYRHYACRGGRTVETGLLGSGIRRASYLVDDSAARKLHLTDMIQMTGGDSTAPSAETYPPLAPSHYTVAPGDTFASIAERMRTSASYATVIAQANGGMSADSVLEPGQVLVIPQLIAMRNTADTHETAQHFMDTLLRNMTVHLNTPQPSSPSFLEEVVGVVIGVVAIMVAPYLATIIGGAVNALEIGVIAAGVDAAGQVVATQLGLQSRFSATQALEVGLTAGIGNYFMPAEGFGQLEWTEQLKICSKVAVAQQMGELALGMRSHLDLQGMIMSAATATLNARLNLKLNGSIGRVGQTVTNAATGAALGGMLTGHVNLEQMAAQMLGSQIGSELGSEACEVLARTVPWRTVGVDQLERFQAQQQAAMRHRTEHIAVDTTISRSVAVRSPAAAISEDPRLAEARKWARVRLDGSVTLDTKDSHLAEYAGDRYFDGGQSAAAVAQRGATRAASTSSRASQVSPDADAITFLRSKPDWVVAQGPAGFSAYNRQTGQTYIRGSHGGIRPVASGVVEAVAPESYALPPLRGGTGAASLLGKFGGLFGRGAVEGTRLISSIKRVSSDSINEMFINPKAVEAGWKPPYPSGIDIREISLSRETQFVRVFTGDDPTGNFLVRSKEIVHIIDNPEAIRLHLGLKEIPTHIANVTVPSETRLLVGRIGVQPNFGLVSKSGFQYQLLDQIPRSNFTNIRPIQQPTYVDLPIFKP